MSSSLLVFGWQDVTDIQNEHANSLCRLAGRWIWMLDLLLASKRICLVDPLPALPCTSHSAVPDLNLVYFV